jgi:hypothetical protein
MRTCRFAGFLLSVGLLCGIGQPASGGTIYFTPAASTTSDGAVDAEASFTILNGEVKLTLTNLFQNPTADGQEISGISFKVTGASGAGSLTTINGGDISQISKGGAYTTGVADALLRWKANEAGTAIDLTALSGGAPNRLIIGPDSAGGFSNVGLFNNANPSITGKHNPNVLGSATFDIYIPGVTTSSTLSDVVFQFGTKSGSNVVNGDLYMPPQPPIHPNQAVPEPGSITLLGLSLATIVGIGWMRRRKATASAD